MTTKREFITIVSGLPRSGTSMMMQMLDKGGIPALVDNIRKADEDNPEGYYEFEPVKKTKQDAAWLKDAPGKVVKMVHLLLLDLPTDREYRVVFMRRELREVIKSQNVMLERNQKGGGDLPDEKVMQVFRMQLDKVYKWISEHPNFKLLEVSYNELLKETPRFVDALDAFLGGGMNKQAMLRVVNPALYRQRA
ncbi:MAG: sulfotransferase family protein [Planctomycetes bacterium]|nr:sulfotransferase family protein [Planctomycetota bacterium]